MEVDVGAHQDLKLFSEGWATINTKRFWEIVTEMCWFLIPSNFYQISIDMSPNLTESNHLKTHYLPSPVPKSSIIIHKHPTHISLSLFGLKSLWTHLATGPFFQCLVLVFWIGRGRICFWNTQFLNMLQCLIIFCNPTKHLPCLKYLTV